MIGIKLARLPDRKPVKLTIQISPTLHHQLEQYAAAYETAYGQSEALTDLVPAMLAAYLKDDREFGRNSRAGKRMR